MIESIKYTDQFFSELESNSYSSAKSVLPIVNEIIKPKSVIDIGCGTGMWLKVWKEELNVTDILGIEGPYVKPEALKVPIEYVQFQDLKKPLSLNKKFDLAMSLEVAEHLPDSVAIQFIKNLTELSDIILFSAAIPDQQGTYHINERYPEYWASLFCSFGYSPVDYIRPKVWNKSGVEYWYQQNILFFIKNDSINKYPELIEVARHTYPNYLTRIHPFLYELKVRHINQTKSLFGFMNWKWYMLKTSFKKRRD